MTTIQYLCLKRNKLSKVSELNDLKNLIEVDLSENDLKDFPDSLIGLTKLEKINLNMNNIDNLFYPSKNYTLKYFYLSNNQFKEIFYDIVNFFALKHISLDGNQITEIKPEMFRAISPTQHFFIGLSNNLITDKSIGNVYEVKAKIPEKAEESKKFLTELERLNTNVVRKKSSEKDRRTKVNYDNLDLIRYKDVTHWIEKKINSELKSIYDKSKSRLKRDMDENEMMEVCSKIKSDYLIKKVKQMIGNNQIVEICNFSSIDLKMDIKSKIYLTI